MANFKTYVTKSPRNGNYTVRYRDGKAKTEKGKWKLFTETTIDKKERILVDGKWKTAAWIAEEIAQKLIQSHRNNELGILDPSLSVESLIEEYINDCSGRGLSPTTIDVYEFGLKHFRVDGDFKTLADLSTEKITQWRNFMCGHMMKSSARSYMRIAKSFVNWLMEEEKIKASPFRRKMMPKVKRPGPKFFTTAEWIALDEASKSENPQVRLAFHLAYCAGLRLGEVAGNKYKKGILWSDLKWNGDGTVDLHIREEVAKTGGGTIRLDPSVVALLGSRGKSGPVITLGRRQLWYRFMKCREKVGNPKLTFHWQRHSFVQNILELGGGDPFAAMEAARHKDIRTTQIYAHHQKPHIIKIMERVHERRLQEEAILKNAEHLQNKIVEIKEQNGIDGDEMGLKSSNERT